MAQLDDTDVKDAMRQVRSGWPPWLLLGITLAVAGWGGYELKMQRDAAQEMVSRVDTRTAKRFAEMAVLEKSKAELEQRVVRLDQEAEALLPLKLAEEKEKEETEARKAALSALRDQITERMKKEIGARLLRTDVGEEAVEVELTEKLLFDTAEATLSKQGEEALALLGGVLGASEVMKVRVEGHADAGTADAWTTSAARAASVTRFLEEKARIDPKLLVAIGRGASIPLVSNKSARGRARNRRVQLSIEVSVPVEDQSATVTEKP